MYHSVDEFRADWKRESEATLRALRTLSDASLSQRMDPEGPTLGTLGWHLAAATGVMGSLMGLKVDAPARGSAAPASANAIVDAYDRASRSVDMQAAETFKDTSLREEVDSFGRRMQRAEVLESCVRHQIHHRGQMTVLMRQAGLVVPGLYGPSREERAKLGLPPATS